MGILMIGTTMVDIKGYPFDTYLPTGRNAGTVKQVHGGVGRNVVEDMGNMGVKPSFMSLVDDSGISMDVIERLKAHNINTDYVKATEDGLGTWLAIFDNSGEVAGSIAKRPNMLPLGDFLDTAGDEAFASADSICIEMDMDPEVVERVYDLAEKHGKKIYALISNIRIAMERRDLIRRSDCFFCNQGEASLLFDQDYDHLGREEMAEVLSREIAKEQIPAMIVTMAEQGAAYASLNGEKGTCPAIPVQVVDTTGAGDSFFAGASVAMTYGKSFLEACQIGARLASSVIVSGENVCPIFTPDDFGIELP